MTRFFPDRSFVVRSCNLALMFVVWLLPTATALAADSSPAHSAACQIDSRADSDADLAYYHGDYKKAAALYAAALKATPTDGRSHELQVDSLIGQGTIDDAQKLTDAWTTTNASDPYAITAAGDVHFAQGHWLEAYALMLKALKADPCIARAYKGAAHYESLAGYRATARKHLILAHQLAPNDDDIRREWILSLGGQATVDALKLLVQNDAALDLKEKKQLSDEIPSLEAGISHQCELASVTGPAIIPMVPIYKEAAIGVQSYGLEVAFNGHKRVLQIDTGATGFLLSHSAEGGTGLKPIGRAAVRGFGGGGPAGTTLMQAESVHIGGLEFKDCPVEALNNFGAMGGSYAMGQQLDDTGGLVGTDVFSRYLVTVDYVKHEVRLDPLPQPSADGPTPPLDALGGRTDPGWMAGDRYIPPSLKSWTEIYRRGHELIVPMLINRETPSLFLIDTGSFTNLIDLGTAKKVTKSQSGMMEMSGLSGTQRMAEAGKFNLDFAGLRIPVLSMDSIGLSTFGGVNGFLGYPTLKQLVMHIDYRDNIVLFEAPEGKKM